MGILQWQVIGLHLGAEASESGGSHNDIEWQTGALSPVFQETWNLNGSQPFYILVSLVFYVHGNPFLLLCYPMPNAILNCLSLQESFRPTGTIFADDIAFLFVKKQKYSGF